MNLGGTVFENIKIEADSDCAFFGIATGAIGDVDQGAGSTTLGQFANGGGGNQTLSTMLSSVSPFTISSPSQAGSSEMGSSPMSQPVTVKTNFVPYGEASMQEDCIGDALFSADITEQLDLDLQQFDCDFDILEDDGFLDSTHALLREDSDSKDSGTSSTPDAYLGSPSIIDSPPLTPPSPVIKVESETRTPPPCSGASPFPDGSGMLPMLHQNHPNGTAAAGLTKILPALKSSRGRSASHDSPDVQALKRHIRMIRNRESASLSRKKKKEYVTTLEQRLKEVETENAHLRLENQLLKTRLLMQQQQSGGGNSAHSKAAVLNNGRTTGPNANKTKLIAKVALLGVCCFMLLSVHTPTSRNHSFPAGVISNSTTAESKVLQNYAPHPDFPPHALPDFPQENHLRLRRSFAWSDDFKETIHKGYDLEGEDKKLIKVNRTSFETPYYNSSSKFRSERANRTRSPTPIHVKRTVQPLHHHHHSTKHSHTFANASIPFATVTAPAGTNCKGQFNKTESLRVQNDLKGLFNRGKAKKRNPPKPFFYTVFDAPSVDKDNNKGLTVYDQRMQKYSNFLEKIQLREDTFYVVSLAMDDQLLLSAKSSNASSRPKMSFLMPWRNDSLGGKEEVMQIDCEVTKILNLNALRKPSKP